MSFSINDRSTWDWRDNGVVSIAWFVGGRTFTVDPGNPAGFYQLLADRPMRQPGPPASTFGYDTASGTLISQPDVMDPAQFNQDTY